MENKNPKNPVAWFEIYVDDMDRARNFYESVFETKLEKMTSGAATENGLEMWSFTGDFSSYGTNGALCKMPGIPAGQTSVLIYFACTNCADVEKRVVEFGGKIERPKQAIGEGEHGHIALVYDTEGNLFGLHSMS